MPEFTLQFLVMIDGPANLLEVVGCLKAAFPDAKGVKAHSYDLRGNWIEVLKNKDFDPIEAESEEDGYLSYRYQLQSTPMVDVGEEHQVQLARDLATALRDKDWKAVVCASFEDRL